MQCSTCGTFMPTVTGLAESQKQCPGCGKVFGEDNRCPHCHAIAGLLETLAGAVCAACGKPRSVTGTSVVLSRPPSKTTTRVRGAALRLLGALAIGFGVLSAAVSTWLVSGATGVVLAILVGGSAVGVGALFLRSASKATEADSKKRAVALERRILDLARKRGGTLTAPETAAALAIPVSEADQGLTALGIASMAVVDVDNDGMVHYRFVDLVAPAVRVRVETDVAEDSDFAHSADANQAKKAHER